MEDKIRTSIVKTLSYSDIFDYPLTRDQLFEFLIESKCSKKELFSYLSSMVNNEEIGKSGKFYFLNGKRKNVSIRKRRLRFSLDKLKSGIKVGGVLSIIPSIKLIGISGSLSLENADRADDIDLFIITSANTLWMTRFVAILVLLVMGAKRSRKDSIGIDKICPNMFISENDLLIKKNMFSAHEIIQMKVLVNKSHTYEKFLSRNLWVNKFLPNAINQFKFAFTQKPNNILAFIDKFFYYAQLSYMHKRKTTEEVSPDLALFHPKDKTNFVLELYKSRSKAYLSYLENNVKSDQLLSFQPQNILQDIDR